MEEDLESYCYYNPYYISNGQYEYGYCSNMRRTYKKAKQEVIDQIEEDNDIAQFTIVKKSFTKDYEITAEFFVKDKKPIMTNIYNNENSYPDISTIFLKLPTPFKKGDLLCSNSNTPFFTGYIPSTNNVFVLEWMITWEKDLDQRLAKGNCDDSDMVGLGYYIYNKDINLDHCYEFDNWEFFEDTEGKLKGMEKILKGVCNLLKGELSLALFLDVYNTMREEQQYKLLGNYTEEGLIKAGFYETDIEKMKDK